MQNIKELDGLPAGEIRLAITQSELRTVNLMEEKLAEHRDVIEKRLDHQDEKLQEMQTDLTALVGSDKVPGLITHNTELLKDIADKHERWHEQDSEFRSDIAQKMQELTDQNNRMSKDMRNIRWLVSFSRAVSCTCRFALQLSKDGAALYKTLAAGGIGWLVYSALIHRWWGLIEWLTRFHR